LAGAGQEVTENVRITPWWVLCPPLCTREESVSSLQFIENQTAAEEKLRRRRRCHITVPHKGDFEIHYLSSYVPTGTQRGL